MRILVTGGGGFLGSKLVERLQQEDHDVAVPRRSETDLIDMAATARLFDDVRPETVFHLAAEVGGIGANQANPGRYWFANLMMGAHILEQARLHGTSKLVLAGTICSYPKFAPVPFREEDLWEGYPEETNAPYGVAKKALLVGAQAYRQQYGTNAIYLLPVNLYGPGDNFDPETSHVIPALIRKMVEAEERASRRSRCGATGRRRASSSTSTTVSKVSSSLPDGTTGRCRSTWAPGRRSRSGIWPSSSARCRATGVRSSGTPPGRTDSRAGSSTRAAPKSCWDSEHQCTCVQGSNAPSPGTASTHGSMRRPDPLLVAAVVLQWIVTAGVAVTAAHSNSLFGDQAAAERLVAASSSLVHGSLPTVSAPGYALLLAPIVAVTDDLGSVASVVTTLNIVILAPLCAFFLFELAQGAAGRLFAGLTMLVWSLAPPAATHLFEPKYHATYVDDVLPALYGLTLQPEYVAMTLSIAAAALAMRAVADRRRCALVAGVLAGAAIGVAPVAAGVALGVLAGIAASGRWRSLLDAGIGLLAAILPTVVWRQRVLGGPTLTLGHPSWSTYQSAMAQVREFFWSNRLLAVAPDRRRDRSGTAHARARRPDRGLAHSGGHPRRRDDRRT